MLRKILKWIGGTIGVMLTLILILYFLMRMRVNSKRDRIHNVEVRMIDIPADSATIAYGAHIYAIKGCNDCHGENLAGKGFLDDPAIGLMAASNLTHGKGGIPADFTDCRHHPCRSREAAADTCENGRLSLPSDGESGKGC